MLVIVALLSAAVVLAVPDERGSLRSEAERFAARTKAAADLAVIGSRPIALRVMPQGYAFEGRDEAGWRPLASDALRAWNWSEGTGAAVAQEGVRIVFDPTGLADPAQIVLGRDKEQVSISIAAGGRIDVQS